MKTSYFGVFGSVRLSLHRLELLGPNIALLLKGSATRRNRVNQRIRGREWNMLGGRWSFTDEPQYASSQLWSSGDHGLIRLALPNCRQISPAGNKYIKVCASHKERLLLEVLVLLAVWTSNRSSGFCGTVVSCFVCRNTNSVIGQLFWTHPDIFQNE
jgi:hypothetical protein